MSFITQIATAQNIKMTKQTFERNKIAKYDKEIEWYDQHERIFQIKKNDTCRKIISKGLFDEEILQNDQIKDRLDWLLAISKIYEPSS